jgi:hypothetical protein
MIVRARYAIGTPEELQALADGTYQEPGLLDTDRLTLRELGQALEPEIQQLDEALEYFSVSVLARHDNPGRLDQPIGPYWWIACYAVTGTSEGHYVHVDRIWSEPYGRAEHREPLFLVKTFSGYGRACAIAAHLGARLGA